MTDALTRIQQGWHHDPFEWLGLHPARPGYVVRAFMPTAESVELEGIGPMQRIDGSDGFEIRLSLQQKDGLSPHYRLCWVEKGSGEQHCTTSPYSFLPILSDFDLNLFSAGSHLHIYRFLGAHLQNIDGVDGCLFAVWAPNVKRVSVIGDFNGWHGLRHPMRNRGASGVWELFIPGLQPGDSYKFEIRSHSDEILHKTDPYARAMGLRPDTTSHIAPAENYDWQDSDWLQQRRQRSWLHEPMSIYEVHAGSWRR
ncbi:MAG TPA: 1,4-alpha-glucan branching enzyme, partial [Gammaproteobacteria bacterium]|nr:1,4-alpha-glucan branching enzyme [Gammaproteobacteria bacterium]